MSSSMDRCLSASSSGEDTEEKNNKKSVTICTVTNDVETSRANFYTRPHFFILLTSKA